jgi:aminopeptidase N
MPGTNLTRDEASQRAALLEVEHYQVRLDLTTGAEHFASTTIIDFTCRQPGAETFADLIADRINSINLNGVDLDPRAVYHDSRISLVDLAEHNTLTVVADCAYSHSGEGLHRFVDPVDDRVYTYSQFEVPDARRVYTTFEQPDLKSVFTFEVITPKGWKVISNAPTPEPLALSDDKDSWQFPTTKPMSTYITAIVAGEYHEVLDEYVGEFGTIPLGHYCRQSLVDHLDSDELVKITRQGFGFFEKAFGYPYPFEKYDQLYVPEYNMGAMENAGCVTLRDEYLPRSRQDGAFYEFRTSVILHEMAHMWFGDLVTMKWWDDLWLNESFAEWACYHAAVEATEFTESWTGFTNARKNWAIRQDQLPSTHPIAADNYDLHQVEANFDGITYAKGASVLKQLVAWVGIDNFLKGLGEYFREHEYSNSEFTDLLNALERSSGRELSSWAEEWLKTTGVNTMTPSFELDDSGKYSRFSVLQTAAPDHPTLRRHRLGIGLYDDRDGQIIRRRYLEVDINGSETELAELIGEAQPDLLLLNDQDLAYTKIRLDDRSLHTMINGLGRLDDSLARALCWGAAWDMTRDAQMRAGDFVDLVLQNISSETDAFGSSRLPGYAAMAINVYSDPSHRESLRARWEEGIKQLMLTAEAGSDHQLTFTRAFAGSARTGDSLDFLSGLLDGSEQLPGLVVDADLRWSLTTALARAGRFGESEIAAAAAADPTITGAERAAAARAARPDAAAKESAWQQSMMDPSTSNETARSIATSFHRAGQEELLAPYLQRYLDAAGDSWERLGSHKAAVALEALFPSLQVSSGNLEIIEKWLNSSSAPAQVKRYVGEGLDDMRRALTAQEYDASRGD